MSAFIHIVAVYLLLAVPFYLLGQLFDFIIYEIKIRLKHDKNEQK